MHWTLQALLWLCAACVLLNAAQYALVGNVRAIGLLVCGCWAVQEAYWWRAGHDSLALFVACDAALIAWALSARRLITSDRVIVATIPLTTALGCFAWLNAGHTTLSWWLSWGLVAAQMVLGLPRPGLQRIFGSVSHGRRVDVGGR